jgi:hypothetical protein
MNRRVQPQRRFAHYFVFSNKLSTHLLRKFKKNSSSGSPPAIERGVYTVYSKVFEYFWRLLYIPENS